MSGLRGRIRPPVEARCPTVLYGNERGDWQLVTGPPWTGVVIPGLRPLGSPAHCLYDVYNWLKHGIPFVRQHPNVGPPAQTMLAEQLGMSQRAVSNWLMEKNPVRLDTFDQADVRRFVRMVVRAEEWRNLTR